MRLYAVPMSEPRAPMRNHVVRMPDDLWDEFASAVPKNRRARVIRDLMASYLRHEPVGRQCLRCVRGDTVQGARA